MAIPKILSAEFILSVHQGSQLPPAKFPEVAFLGRSNVGKSSLINALLGRRHLVRVSSTPGCTRSLNFFLINGRWYFVDLPGFGYAKVSREIKAKWGPLVLDYLERRDTLAGVVLLQDSRRLPGPEELFLLELLRAKGRALIPVLTKADKLKRGERARQLKEIARVLGLLALAPEDFVWFSASTHEGRDQLWGRILECLKVAGEGPGT